jgi:hypothetical protein
MLKGVEDEYFKQPLICFVTKDQESSLADFMEAKGWSYYLDSSHELLQTLKTKDTGVLLLRKEHYRGIDTKFKSDALVIIGYQVDNIQQYSQMIGRSSRKRGPCKGIMFAVSN